MLYQSPMWSAAFEPVAMKFHVTPPYSSRYQQLCPVYKPVRGCWQFKRNVPDDHRQNVSILFRRQTLQSAGFSVGRGATIQAGQGGCGPRRCDAGPDREAVRHGHPQTWSCSRLVLSRHAASPSDVSAARGPECGYGSGRIPTVYLSEHSAPMPGAFGNQDLIIDTADKQFNWVGMSTAHCSLWTSGQSQFVATRGTS